MYKLNNSTVINWCREGIYCSKANILSVKPLTPYWACLTCVGYSRCFCRRKGDHLHPQVVKFLQVHNSTKVIKNSHHITALILRYTVLHNSMLNSTHLRSAQILVWGRCWVESPLRHHAHSEIQAQTHYRASTQQHYTREGWWLNLTVAITKHTRLSAQRPNQRRLYRRWAFASSQSIKRLACI